MRSEECSPFLCIVCRESLNDFSRPSKHWNQCSWDSIEKQSNDESDAMDSDYVSETESTDESLHESMEVLNLLASSRGFQFMD